MLKHLRKQSNDVSCLLGLLSLSFLGMLDTGGVTAATKTVNTHWRSAVLAATSHSSEDSHYSNRAESQHGWKTGFRRCRDSFCQECTNTYLHKNANKLFMQSFTCAHVYMHESTRTHALSFNI